ncbi:MAG: glycosyltransferase [Acidobacteriaceae bacterium]
MQRTIRILAVVVLYKQRADESPTLRALLPRLGTVAGLDIRFVLFDNGPEPAEPTSLAAGVEYHAADRNEGLAGAYNYGLRQAVTGGYEWLLTLDQDTELPAHFLQSMRDAAEELSDDESIAAIVPHLVDAGMPVSPVRVRFARITPIPAGFSGVPDGEARAFNSAALLRVSALQELGGFNPCFWLSFLDGWLHREFHLRGKKIFVLGSVHSEHKLSLLNYRERLSLAHFRNFLSAESAFHDLYCGRLEGVLYTARLVGRLVHQAQRKESPEILKITFSNLLHRLTTWSRQRRLARWRADAGCAAAGSTHVGLEDAGRP